MGEVDLLQSVRKQRSSSSAVDPHDAPARERRRNANGTPEMTERTESE